MQEDARRSLLERMEITSTNKGCMGNITRRGWFKAAIAAVAAIYAPKTVVPPAISIPFSTLPLNVYIKGPRYRVMFERFVVPQLGKKQGSYEDRTKSTVSAS